MINDLARSNSIASAAAAATVALLMTGAGQAPPPVDGVRVDAVGEQSAATVVGPDIISTSAGEGWITFDPTGNLVVFGRHDNAGWNHHTIYLSTREPAGWSTPTIAPFSGSFEDRGARFSPDGQRLIFSSNRPRPGEGTTARRDFDLWTVERSADRWSEPTWLALPISSDENDFHASIASDGTIYFASSRAGGAGRSDIYVARVAESGEMVVTRLGTTVNTSYSEPDVFVDPAQRFMIMSRTDDPMGVGGDDLYLVMRDSSGEWSLPKHLGDAVNTSEYEYGPFVSRDGAWLYFTSHRGGEANLYQISASAVGIPSRQ